MMAEFHHAALLDRAVISVRGADARHFLHNLVTANIEAVGSGMAAYGALLSPQGKVQFDFVAFADTDGFLLDTARDRAEDFARRLGFYKLRAAVAIALHPGMAVHAAWGSPPPPDGAVAWAADPRNAALGLRIISPDGIPPYPTEAATAAAYEAFRIALGVPAGGYDFAYGDAFPHDIDMDQLGGIDFKKGCYTGQEVVSRMEHRGTARRRIVKIAAAEPLPPTGTTIEAGGIAIGSVGSVAGNHGIAMVRLDRAKEALDAGIPIVAARLPLDVRIPDWARFTWPQAAAE